MSNHPELNQESTNPTGQFGFQPIYTTERPSTEYTRGGPPVCGKTIIITEPWEVSDYEYMLVVSYDDQGKRAVKVLVWHQHRMRWDNADLPRYALEPLGKLADALSYPATIPAST